MYSVARAQAKLEQELQRPVTMMDVVFRRPLILPAEAHFYYADTATKFIVTDAKASKAFLDGTFCVKRTRETIIKSIIKT